MTAKEAMNIGKSAMEKLNFQYDMIITNDSEISRPVPLDQCNMIHLNVPLANSLDTVQTAITFYDGFCDIRTFPDPIRFDPKDRAKAVSVFELLNHLNLYIKTGRFYADMETGDIALWIRIPYWVLEKLPETLTDAVIVSYQYYSDVGEAIAGCVVGGFDADEAIKFVDEKWS